MLVATALWHSRCSERKRSALQGNDWAEGGEGSQSARLGQDGGLAEE